MQLNYNWLLYKIQLEIVVCEPYTTTSSQKNWTQNTSSDIQRQEIEHFNFCGQFQANANSGACRQIVSTRFHNQRGRVNDKQASKHKKMRYNSIFYA